MEIKIIPFEARFAKDVAKLERECFSDPWSENAILEAFEYQTVFFLAQHEGEIIGYAGMKPVLDEGYITNVAVGLDHRRKGVATLLMEEIENYSKKIGLASVSLEVRASNEAAISLYQAFGYESVGKRKNFYSHPTEDGLIMTVKVG